MTAFYDKAGEGFLALEPATGPWDSAFQNGVALSGLLAHVAETTPSAPDMDVARFNLDILKPVAMAKPMQISRTLVRDGRRLQVLDLALTSDGELAARATVVRLRLSDTPNLAPRLPPADPGALEFPPMATRRPMRGLLQSRLLRGGLDEIGSGDAWFRIDADIVEGSPITPFVTAAMASDFGSALSCVLDWREFTFANVDISIHLTRAPQDAWVRVEAETVTHGGGRALVNSILSDRFGPYAQVHQTLFVDPRPPARV